MAAKVKVVINRKGVRDLLRSDEVKADLERRAQQIAAQAGEGFEASSFTGKNRARASVITDTFDAILAESNDHVLSSAIDAGR